MVIADWCTICMPPSPKSPARLPAQRGAPAPTPATRPSRDASAIPAGRRCPQPPHARTAILARQNLASARLHPRPSTIHRHPRRSTPNTVNRHGWVQRIATALSSAIPAGAEVAYGFRRRARATVPAHPLRLGLGSGEERRAHATGPALVSCVTLMALERRVVLPEVDHLVLVDAVFLGVR